MDIAAWLRRLGLERYDQAFRENEIDAVVLPTLTAEDLKDLGVTVIGHRRKLLNAIAIDASDNRPISPRNRPRYGPQIVGISAENCGFPTDYGS